MTAEAPALRRYLREMGAAPLLDPREEVRLAVRLRDARLAIAELAKALPEPCRATVLEGDPSGPESGAAWPVVRLERFLHELERYASLRPNTKVVASLRAIRAHKASLDEARNGLTRYALQKPDIHPSCANTRHGLNISMKNHRFHLH